MIEAEYVRLMARYNTWQNKKLMPIVEAMDEDSLILNRGAFFGSILGTLNHLLWGDRMWMSRFDPSVDAPSVGVGESTDLTPTISVWGAERFHLDGKIRHWAKSLSNVDLQGELKWYSGSVGMHLSRPMALCVAHFFNHQTHHRGQVHAMLTAAGAAAPVSDLFLMPETL